MHGYKVPMMVASVSNSGLCDCAVGSVLTAVHCECFTVVHTYVPLQMHVHMCIS